MAGTGLGALVAGLGPSAAAGDIADLVAAEMDRRELGGGPVSFATLAEEWPDLPRHPEGRRAALMHRLAPMPPDEMAAEAVRLTGSFPDIAADIAAVTELCGAMAGTIPTTREGDRLGKYTLVARLGTGTFGDVWQALDVELNRYVALKLLRDPAEDDPTNPGHAYPPFMRRVMSEAMAAAGLDHPNIVKVYAAGRFPDGRGYIDAQLAGDPAPTSADPRAVAVGAPLDAARAPGARAAASLLEPVIRGVAAAHARGVVHRDIKPANIIVTPRGRAMLTDFGLSVLAAQTGGGPRGITGTPAFMSPEQARGERATPASDVYSLGGTLRYLLLGELPVRPSGRHDSRARADVLEQVRRGEVGALADDPRSASLPTTLVRIVDRAMAARPQDRYVSAEQLADDLAAWMAHRPTLAGRESAGRRTAMWLRRNAPVAAVAGLAAVIIVGGGLRFVSRVSSERDRAIAAEHEAMQKRAEAEEAGANAEAVTKFMTDTLLAAQSDRGARSVTLLEAIGQAADQIPRATAGKPLVEAAVRHAIGRSLSTLAEFGPAEENLRRALEIRAGGLGPEHPQTLLVAFALAEMLSYAERIQEADAIATPLLATVARVKGEHDELTLSCADLVASIRLDQNRPDEAEAILTAALEKRLAERPPDEAVIALTTRALAKVERARGNREKAAELFARELEVCRRIHGDKHLNTIASMSDLGSLLAELGRVDEAEPLQREAYEWMNETLSPRHVNTLTTGYNLAWLLLTKKNAPEESLEIARRVAADSEAVFGPDHPVTLRNRLLVARGLAASGRCEEAAPMLEAVADKAAAAGKVALVTEAVACRTLSECLTTLTRSQEAARWKARADQRTREARGQ